MNGIAQLPNANCDVIVKPDLLPHKYRPESASMFTCHLDKAQRLKQWILDFREASKTNSNNNNNDIDNNRNRQNYNDDYDDSSGSDYCDALQEGERKCVLLTGPPGVGKTSLVYTVANELKMHVVESHSSERRDFKLFSTLKLANQKGRINPIAKLFQFAENKKQHQNLKMSKRKRRKLDELQEQQEPVNDPGSRASNGPPSQCLSLIGGSSIVLFDDIDVVFEEDGPFLKSLVEFIKESKRPVVMTATKSIDYIKEMLVHVEHIELDRPNVDICIKVMRDVCRRENYHRLSKVTNCKKIAKKMDCDLRKCLNRIHFYGDQANDIADDKADMFNVRPDLNRLNRYLTSKSNNNDVVLKCDDDDEDATDIENDSDEECESKERINLLECYDNSSVIDLLDSAFNFIDRSKLLARWMDGKPSLRNEEHSSNHDLGEQIKESIVELTRNMYRNEMLTIDSISSQQEINISNGRDFSDVSHMINLKIKGRVEPPEREFFTDIVPMLTTTITMEAQRRRKHQQSGNNTGLERSPAHETIDNGIDQKAIIARRTRRVQSYLETIPVYLDTDQFDLVSRVLHGHESPVGNEE